MPTGPWLTPPVLSQTVRWNSAGFSAGLVTQIDGAGFATQPYDLPSTFTETTGTTAFSSITVEPFVGVSDVEVALWLLVPTDLSLGDYVPSSLPANATGIDYDAAGVAVLQWPVTVLPDPALSGMTFGTADPTVTAIAKRVPDGAYLQSGLTATVAGWPSPSTVAPWSTVLTLDQAGGVTPAGVDLNPGGLDSGGGAVFWTGYNAFANNTVAFVSGGIIPTVHYSWQPRRYRFIYSTLPPLRQFPRDDAVGGAPRQGHRNGPTSVQSSTRQGWRGTYR